MSMIRKDDIIKLLLEKEGNPYIYVQHKDGFARLCNGIKRQNIKDPENDEAENESWFPDCSIIMFDRNDDIN